MATDKHLISVAEFKILARPTSVHIDDNEVLAYVREAEDVSVKPLIGIDTFTTLVEAISAATLSEELQILFEGGTYTPACDCAETKECAGLKRAVAYLAYARMIAANGGMVSRTGYYQHDDSYSSRVQDGERNNARREVQNMADYYLGTCADYWATQQSCCGHKAVRGGNVRLKSIGYISE